MAEKYSFFDPVVDENGEYDREYNAQQFTDFFGSLITTGIMKGLGAELKVSTSGSNMVTEVDIGVAFLEGRYYGNTSKLALTHDTETLGKNRIDRIVVRLDLNTEARHVRAFIKKGVASASPVPPVLQRGGGVYEISLAQVKVIGGQTYINSVDVTDERGQDAVCPWAGSNILPNFDDEALQDLVDEVNNLVDEVNNKGEIKDTTETWHSIWIDGVNGDDTTGNGTIDFPFKTITKAVENMPKGFFGYGVELILKPATYDEDVSIEGVMGSTLQITGTDRNTVNVRRIEFSSCNCIIKISNLTLIGIKPYVASLQFLRCFFSDVRYLTIKNSGNGVRGIIFGEGSNGVVLQTSITDKQVALMVDNGFVKTYGLTGSRNETAYSAIGGTIFRGGTNPSATTLESKSNGGQIHS